MGKAIRNFKDSLSGIEEAKYRKVEDDSPKASQPKTSQEETLHS